MVFLSFFWYALSMRKSGAKDSQAIHLLTTTSKSSAILQFYRLNFNKTYIKIVLTEETHYSV